MNIHNEYRLKILLMDDQDLLKETSLAITYAAEETHLNLCEMATELKTSLTWNEKSTACYHEWTKRGKNEYYTIAYRKAFKEAIGYEPREVGISDHRTCG